jgi:hypothetical protein
LQEFLIRKLTPNLPAHDPTNGSSGAPGKVHGLVGRAFSPFAARTKDGD